MNLQDLLTVASLTASINKLPAKPGKVGAMGLFEERGIATTTVVIDERDGRLVLVPNTSRSADPTPAGKGKRRRRTFETLHLPLSAQILPGELQNIAGFGEETVENGQAAVINDKLQGLKDSIEATREFQRVGALRGQLLDADGSVIYSLFDEFGVTKKSINIAFGTDSTDVRKHCLDAIRHSEKKLAGVAVRGFRAMCGPEFFDSLTAHPNVQKAYAAYQEAADRIGGDMRQGFRFGGIEFIEYDVTVSGQKFIPDDVAQVFPIASGVFQMVNAPANYNEAVNTVGKPFYAKAEARRMGKGWDLEAQSNPLALCLFPEALVELKAP